jgi:hypothetical protein
MILKIEYTMTDALALLLIIAAAILAAIMTE